METALLAAVCVTLLTGVWAQGRQSALADKVVRLHVIAASDSAGDQRVKLEVRDALLAYLTPRLEAASGAQDAAAVIAAASGELQRIAETASGGQRPAWSSGVKRTPRGNTKHSRSRRACIRRFA